MSYNHQRAPAAQPETGSSGFGADCFDSMVSIDDNFNVYYGGFEDTLRLEDVDWAPFTCGIAPGEILQAPEYAGAGQFDLNGLEPSANFRQDFSAQQPPIFSSADADALFAGLGPDASLPVVEQQNNQALDEFQRDLAPLVSAPASAASTPVADHFTSDADLPVDDEELEDDSNSLFSDTPSAAESPVQEHFTSDDDLTIENEQPHQNAFNIEVPASAGAHQSETDYLHLDDMALEQQQQLWNFHTFNTYQNLQQSPPESNIASSDGSSQLQVQANSTSDAPAPMSEQQLEMFRRHMATQLNRPGLTKQAKFDYLRSVPAHIMDQLRIAHPMPSAQHRATAPEVPGQTSQQNSAMYQQSDVSYQPQAQSARIPPQQNFSMLYGSAEPSQPQVPSFQPPQKNGFMFQDAMAPFPSQTPLTHGSPLQNSAMFLQSTGPSHSQASLARGSPVQSLQPARKARGRRPAPIAKPAPFTQLSADDCHYWSTKIYDAMIDISNMIDGPTSTNRRRFEDEPFWDSQDLEAVAHNIFDATVAVHDRGWNRLSTYHKKTVRGKLLDKAMQSVETRLAMVCDLLRTSKAVVDDCLRGGVTLALVVDNPACRKATKESNNAGNNKRGIRLAFVKKVLEKEQGRPVTEEQVAELEKQVEQEEEDERVRNRERVKASQKVHRDTAKAKAEAARM
ncbi:hypothetical protein SNOG_00350 [Parastagonospora nodorum SN15]|uniref:Uncharacterized protein n=1 Tax=Phaeosphaeria nodorum (strain SN15 / ATCC MYA-4574 / FGSC 10173) TaxID=321614 RepID=Q0V6L4_PHANO|nr:hypothetical protein SNOG_00350 [Parastagonospora nodorum SN15]EAT91845.1 hypothetical protein SNOG_00350 [Parastagonospora nodorum SN15]